MISNVVPTTCFVECYLNTACFYAAWVMNDICTLNISMNANPLNSYKQYYLAFFSIQSMEVGQAGVPSQHVQPRAVMVK